MTPTMPSDVQSHASVEVQIRQFVLTQVHVSWQDIQICKAGRTTLMNEHTNTAHASTGLSEIMGVSGGTKQRIRRLHMSEILIGRSCPCLSVGRVFCCLGPKPSGRVE